MTDPILHWRQYWTDEERYYAALPDSELAAAYRSFLNTYRRSSGRDQAADMRKLALIADVAWRQGRFRVIEEAAAAARAGG